MESAKNAVKDFMSKSGHHDTTVHETFAPAVTQETVNKHKHEEIQTAVDKEIHQDHYHTTVQPIHDTQKLQDQHHHNVAAVEHRKFEHGNDDEVQRRLAAEQAKFRDNTVQGETKHTQSTASTLTGEHVHHHVHENIQPVIQRQTIENHVVHTVVPIHETHHTAAQHHSTSALPAMSLADFKKQGGALGGREQRTDFFEGEPRSMSGHNPLHPENASHNFRKTGHVDQHGNRIRSGSSSSSSSSDDGKTGHRHRTKGTGLTGSHHTGTTGTTGGLTGNHGTTGSSGLTGDRHTGTGSGLTGNHGTGSSGLTGNNTTGSGLTGNHGTGSGLTGTNGTTGTSGVDSTGSTTKTKPSLLDRLNPMKDTDGDGKKGVME